MDEKDTAAWVAALRSGRYQQAKSRLRTDDGMCCLGVRCDLINPDAWIKDAGQWVWRSVYDSVYDGELRDEAVKTLTGMNDDEDEDFFAIADKIEELDAQGLLYTDD